MDYPYGFHTSRFVKENGEVVNFADVNLTTVGTDSRLGSLEVSPTPTEVFSDSVALEGRNEVMIFNDSSVFIYWSFTDTPTIGEDTMPIPSGVAITFKLDPNNPRNIYLVTSEFTTDIKIVELK